MIAFPHQIWGGGFYLLNKLCFSRAERSISVRGRRRWRIRSWLAYLAGLPAWVLVFISEHDWIAAGVETGGAPAMLMGLFVALRGQGKAPQWLDGLAKVAVLTGLATSVYEFGGIKHLSQMLEMGVAAGFLMGTYMMAKDRAGGYLWLMVGNVSCASLMGIQGYDILMIQQLMSLGFVSDAWRVRRKRISEVQAFGVGHEDD